MKLTTVITIAAALYIMVLLVQGVTDQFRKAQEKHRQDIENIVGVVQDVEPAPRSDYPHNDQSFWNWVERV